MGNETQLNSVNMRLSETQTVREKVGGHRTWTGRALLLDLLSEEGGACASSVEAPPPAHYQTASRGRGYVATATSDT